MKVIDTHCDALLKLQMEKRGVYYGRKPLDFQHADMLDTNLDRLRQGKIGTQFYAIFIEPDIPMEEKWQHALEQIDLFHTEILDKHPEMRHIRSWSDLKTLHADEIGAVLTLEGADPIGNDLGKLRHLYRAGVLAVGLTWNHANLCADGVHEPRGGGLTLLGREVIRLNNAHQVMSDVAHSTVRGFWDIVELADYPFASHSNARAVCDHPRNLYDGQIKALIEKGGMIHVVFHPEFISDTKEQVEIDDLIRHIDHICSLGGVEHIGFGSDFDGIDKYVDNLENAAKYQNLINALLNHYPEEQVRGFAGQNFLKHMPN
ncbi:dipeptidase [Virgibacillus xinjiangensis]|uniref:Dipeptidase n=1 Tax=Virgibacillus xinjiangensis TaxID=393090 RepID=A0ABV7CSX6_9BACI